MPNEKSNIRISRIEIIWDKRLKEVVKLETEKYDEELRKTSEVEQRTYDESIDDIEFETSSLETIAESELEGIKTSERAPEKTGVMTSDF